MTGLRASPMRRRVCVSCQTKFVPKRLDAVTCSDRCRMAEYRKRDARAKAEALFKTRKQIERNTADQAWQLDFHRFLARGQNLRADSLRHKHIRFMGVQRGVLGVQADRAADLPWPIPWKPAGGSWLEVQELTHEPANPDAGDPEVIEAVVESLQHETLGGSFMQREFETECRALLRGPVKRIALFTVELREGPIGSPLAQWQFLNPVTSDYWEMINRWDDSRWDDDHVQDRGNDLDAVDLLASGGFGVFKP